MGSKNITRRNLIIGGGIAAAGIAGATVAYEITKPPAPSTVTLTQPEIIAATDGVLDITLTAAPVEKTIAGKTVTMAGYNGSVPGPTLRLHQGDLLRVKLVNQLGATTNLHTHGLHVPATGNADNPLLMISDGESFQYEYRIPQDHPGGTFWYHPHHHGQTANQVFAGLYGTIEVMIGDEPGLDERVLVISDTSFTTDGKVAGANMMSKRMGREGDYILVNGSVQPVGSIAPDTAERWRIVNACTSRYLNLSVDGAWKAEQIAVDGHDLEATAPAQGMILAPGNRTDLLVWSGKTGEVRLNYTTVPHPDSMNMGQAQTTYRNYALATIGVSKDAAKAAIAVPTFVPQRKTDLRNVATAAKRTFVLNMPTMNAMMSGNSNSMSGMSGMSGMENMPGMGGVSHSFTINGQSFNPNRVDTTVALGTVEEWTIVNKSTMAHPFHLHIWPQQVLKVGTDELSEVRVQDVVNVPAKSSVVVRIEFTDYAGPTVYHCHILDHEDLGMMGLIEAK